MGHLLHLWQQDLQAIKMQSATGNNEGGVSNTASVVMTMVTQLKMWRIRYKRTALHVERTATLQALQFPYPTIAAISIFIPAKDAMPAGKQNYIYLFFKANLT